MGTEKETAIIFLSPLTSVVILFIAMLPLALASGIFPFIDILEGTDQLLGMLYIGLIILTAASAAKSLRQIVFVAIVWLLILSTSLISPVLTVVILIPVVGVAGIALDPY